MYCTKKTPIKRNLRFNGFVVGFLLCLFLSGLLGPATAQTESEYEVKLRSRTFTPVPGISEELTGELEETLGRGETRHVYVQMERHLNEDERIELAEAGVKLLSYIGSYTWHATITDAKALGFTSSAAVKRTPILAEVKSVAEIETADKIEPKIREEGVGDYNRNPDDTVNVVVVFFPDVSGETVRSICGQYGETLRDTGMLNDVVLRLEEGDIETLADENTVQWIEEVGPLDQDGNDGAALAVGINPLWIAPFDLDGTNVQVGMWETGNPDGAHGDLIGRINIEHNVGVSDHGTHVAGILGGDGSLSLGDGGAANQWRGVADQVDFFSYSTVVDALNHEPEDHDDAINIEGIDISTNSWGNTNAATYGDYRVRSPKYDNIVRGLYGRPIPIIFISQNFGPGFNTTTPPGGTAKNTIVVGNVESDTLNISNSSGRGPTDNDQIKPDLVAPGSENGGDGGINSTIPNLFIDIRPTIAPDGIDDFDFPYDVMSGTSMAAPLVSGVIALMLQQYRQTFYGDETVDEAPLPSTFKAILCHTADDLTQDPDPAAPVIVYTGPDYIYGYGLIDPQEAVEAISDARFIEGVILSDSDIDTYRTIVNPGDAELKVTLVWDDVPGVAGAADILHNDLDLLLIDPAGTAFYPPWQLDPANPENPAERDSYATEALADAERDNVNVTEQVCVDAPAAGVWTIMVKVTNALDLPEPPQRYSLIAGTTGSEPPEGNVDIMQVLDRSGSMTGLVSSDPGADTKLVTLEIAANAFIEMMKPDIDNRLGIVQFDYDVVDFPAPEPDLQYLTSGPGGSVDIMTGAITPMTTDNGRTSIGDGLREAYNQLTDPGLVDPNPDQVIVLMSDGKENEPEDIINVQPDLIGDEIAVYALGLGYSSGIDEAKLTDLADATGGTYRITSDSLVFRKFFLEALAGAVNWAVVTDPIGELGPSEDTVPVTITSDDVGVTFTAYWEGDDPDDAVEMSLLTPSNIPITPVEAATDDRIRYVSHPRYAFYQIDYPMAGNLTSEHAGEWKIVLTRKESGTIRYSTSVFSEKGPSLDVKFDKLYHLTGDNVLMTARLKNKGKPITGANIDVYCDVPAIGAGNVLHDGKVSMDDINGWLAANPDYGPIDSKLQLLSDSSGYNVLVRDEANFSLYDDGKHNDIRANDGVYANTFADTEIPGSFTFRFAASNITAGDGSKTTREWTKSFFNEVDSNPDYSTIDLKTGSKTDNGYYVAVKFAPRDKFGNYLGPGHVVTCEVDGQTHTLTDNIDGTYTANIVVARPETAKMEFGLDGKEFTNVGISGSGKLSASFHGGYAIPLGTFANDFDPGFNILADVGYRFKPQISIVGFFGYNAFKAKDPHIEDDWWININANVKYTQPLVSPITAYATAGPGYYISGTETKKFGFNVGAGIDYALSNLITLELGTDYHRIIKGIETYYPASQDDLDFQHIHAGIIFNF